MKITPQMVKELRESTGAGMADCKKALEETQGNFEEAVEFLRKKGAASAAKRSDKEANEGLIVTVNNDDKTKTALVAVTCETDFVAKNQEFVAFAEQIADAAMENFPADKEALLALEINGLSIKDSILDQMAKIGEKLEISNYEVMEATNVVSYIHSGNKIGVLVGLTVEGDNAAAAGKDAAMQIAAMNPLAIDKTGIAQDVIDRELEIAKEQIRAEGKPAE